LLRRQALEALSVRPVTGDDQPQALVERRRLEQEVDPLCAVEPADGEDELTVPFRHPVSQLLRRRRQHLRLEARRALEPVGDVLRDRE
jgi:hypothetical protein